MNNIKQKGWISRLKIWVIAIPIAVFLIYTLHFTFFEGGKIPSTSMMPTFRIGDTIWINKSKYGIRLPFINKKFLLKTPNYGDIIVFIHPKTNEYYIKRVVGLPNDEIMTLGHRVWLNGKPLERYSEKPDNINLVYWSSEWSKNNDIYWATNIIGKKYRLLWAKDADLSWQLSGYWLIPDNAVFVMGDYRDGSSDSRDWGPVPLDNVIGKVVCVIDGGDIGNMKSAAVRTSCNVDSQG